jgi:pimeloyl-ACP methyl ester carboxylesterase
MIETAASADGVVIEYERHGSGSPALVFVHGWSCDRTYWRDQIQYFGERHLVAAIDLAGHGGSGAGRREWTIPSFGHDVVAVVDALGLQDIVLIGHSMGGDVIVEAALQVGSRARGLVWVDVYHSLADPRSPEMVARFVEPFRQRFVERTTEFVRGMFMSDADPELVEQVANDMAAAPPEVALDAMVHAVANAEPMIASLPKLTVPVVAINGGPGATDHDGLRQLGIEAVVLPDVGHFLMLEDPPGFNRLLDETLRRLG